MSDSTGSFAIWHVVPGRYVMNVRRIGFTPSEAIVTIDTSTMLYDFTMEPNIPMLVGVEIRETLTNGVSRRLERVGFTSRAKTSGEGMFLGQDEMMKRQPVTLYDILATYGLRASADYVLDRMPVDYDDLVEYPAELVAGIEVYRHGRPMEFGMTRSGPTLLAAGGMANLMRPLVVVWTY